MWYKMATGKEINIDIASTLTEDEKALFGALLGVVKASSPNTVLRVAGGWVRDRLLGVPSDDIDIMVNNTSGEDFARLVARHIQSNDPHVIRANPEKSKFLETARARIPLPSGKVQEIDFAQARQDTYSGDSRIPEIRPATPQEDAFRRDLTINSMFYNINEGTLEDFTGMGLEDLKNNVVRTPLDPEKTFRDDPLRIFRVIRFAARFGGAIDEKAWKAMSDPSLVDDIKRKVSKERIGVELVKMLKGDDPSRALLLLKNSGLFSELMVEAVKGTKYEGKLSALDMDQNNPYHMLDLWAHTMQTVANVFSKYGEADAEKRVSILLAALMHDLGKLYKDVQLTVGDKTSYHGHEDESKEMATLILGYLRLEPYIKEVSGLVEHHMRPHRFLPGEGEANMRSMRRFVRKMGEQSLDWLDVFNLAAADALAKDVQIDEELAEKCRQTEELLRDAHASLGEVPVASAVPQVLDGNEIMDALGIRPGAWMGKLIEFVRGLRDENPAITKEEAAKRLRDEFADDPELAQAKKKTAGAGAESWYVTAKKSEKKAPKKTRSRSKWTPVDSTCVKAISYDPESRRLDVKLHDGSRYAYDDVPWQTHRAMMKARSKGEFFNRIVKKKYPLLLD